MKSMTPKNRLVLILCVCSVLAGPLFSQSSERYFDQAEISSPKVRLTVLSQLMFALRTLDELRNQGFLTVDNLLVIGVYHENELTNNQSAIRYVERQNIEWFKFHRIAGELTSKNLFQNNSCSADFKQIIEKSDGLIFFGGADIPPSAYKKKTNLLTVINTPFRHFLELSCAYHLLGGWQDENFTPLLQSRPDFAVLGICLGCQSLNVATGGTLAQDIWSEVYKKKYFEDVINLDKHKWHRNPYCGLYPEEKLSVFLMHPIKLEGKGLFCTQMGFSQDDTPYVSSAHHQALKKLGKGLKVTATSLDGRIIEAVEHKDFAHVLGVQFHPEMSWLWDESKEARFLPEDKDGISYYSIMVNNPPSFVFHKKLWHWFSEKLKASHKAK